MGKKLPEVPKGKKRLKVRMNVEVILDVDEGLLEECKSAEWRSQFYKLMTDQDVAEHLVHNFVVNHAQLDQLDGFAHRNRDDVVAVSETWEVE